MLEEDTSASRSLVEHSRSHGARTRQEGGRALGPGAQPRPCPRAQPEGYPPPCSLMTEKARAICVGGLRLKSKPRDSSKPTMEKEQPVIKAEGGKKKKNQNSLPHLLGEPAVEFILHFSVAEFFVTWSTDSLLFK